MKAAGKAHARPVGWESAENKLRGNYVVKWAFTRKKAREEPFYGVPVHLHYVTTDKAEKSLPLRFVASDKSRVEVYAMDGTPLSVDGQGNGSLRDRGDELFGASDREGNLLLSLTDGAASFMILIYPNGPLPVDGLNLNVEAYQDGAWALHSQNRLMP